jgi:phosphate transport system substrate-binding protein
MLISATLLAGCYQVSPHASQPDGVPQTPVRVPNVRPMNTTVVDGSAIVAGIVRNVALGFEGFTPGYPVQIGSVGTRDGFNLFCADRTDIQAAVRLMDANESAACTRNGVDAIQLIIAYDVLAVIGDVPLGGCISASELRYLYSHDVSKATWRDIRAGLPRAPVRLFAPPADTAAAQFFAERVVGDQSGQKSARPASIQQLVAEGNGIGYLPVPQARKLNGRLQILAVNSGSGCTPPTDQATWDGSYSFLSRPLYLYVNRESVRRSEVFRFLSYLLSVPGKQHVLEAGFIPAPPEVYGEAQAEIDRVERAQP